MPYHDFFKIVDYNYSPTEIGMLGWWADEKMKNLDYEIASSFQWADDAEFGVRVPDDIEDANIPYDWLQEDIEWEWPHGKDIIL